ncbi:MAG: protein kinase, partial [Deltaproteobacteria bacterium]|nr:protein kinase [Deltaproteobacteria bacterium]
MASRGELHGLCLDERIGAGGIADVFRTTWEGKAVALKVLHDPDRPAMRKRFLREGRLLQRLSHPGLVRCLHVFGGSEPALVLELLRGEPLDERIARRVMNGEEAVQLAQALLHVLQYLHEHGIVHRDVKASNVYCADDSRVVLMDLGLAVDPADPLTTTLGDVLGTYAYMAPEQIAGAESDHRTDLYSLGITLYEAVCGARPFSARGAADWLSVHRTGGATPLIEVAPGIPVRLASLVDRLMSRDPAGRPPSAAVALALLTGSMGIRRDLRRPSLVGRAAARGAMEAAIDTGGFVVVTGPFGSGFGALARLARATAGACGMETVTVRGRSRMRPHQVCEAIAAELACLGMKVPPEEADVRAALVDLGRDSGVLLVTEDADALSGESLKLVADLSRLDGVASIVLGVDVAPIENARHVALRPLSAGEIRQLLVELFDSPTVPPGLEVAVVEASGGVPALAVALLREQAQGGGVWCEGTTADGHPAWRWAPAAGLAPGATTQRLLNRALRRLPPATRRVLDAVAVAGGPVPVDLLLEAAGADASGLDLGPALRQGFVAVWSRRGSEEWVSLTRAALESAILAHLADGHRRAMHHALADAARARPSGEWEQRFLVLHDALGSGAAEKIVQLVELGEYLSRADRPQAALDTIEQAGDAVNVSAELAARRALARAEALRSVGRLCEAREALAAGDRLAREAGALRILERADALSLEVEVSQGSPPDPSRVERVARLAESGRVEAQLASGDFMRRIGDGVRAEHHYRACLADSPTGQERAALRARIGLAALALSRGATDDAERMMLALVRELRGRERRTALSDAFLSLAVVQRTCGQLSRAMDSLDLAAAAGAPRQTAAQALAGELTRA